MTKHLFKGASWLFIFTVFTSCSAQDKKALSDQTVIELEVAPTNHQRLSKTLGSRKGDNIHYSIQDKQGDLWFGTTGEGVYRYNGSAFEQYTMADGLISNLIYCIFEDNDGKIWIGTDNGVSIYDGRTFTEFPITPPLNSLHNKLYVWSIMQDRGGTIWLATVEGVFTYDGKRLKPFVVNAAGNGFISNTNNVEYILEDDLGNMWFGGRVNKGVYKYDGIEVVNYPLETLAGHDWAWPVLQDSHGDIWFNNWGGVYRYDGDSFESITSKDGLAEGAIMRIIEDRSGNLWFGGASPGITKYNGKSFTHFKAKNNSMSKGVWTLMEDDAGTLWIGTTNTELYRLKGTTLIDYSGL